MSLIRLLLSLLILNHGQAVALSTDRDQPFLVEAESATVNEKSGTTVYRGNVTVNQGSMNISSDEIEIITSEGVVVQIIARSEAGSGRLARLEQQPDGEQPVFANARTISYFISEERVHLTGNAKVIQAGDEFTGEMVYYDVASGIVNLTSSGERDDRIKIRYNTRSNTANPGSPDP
ncbi:MAG: lipopolysaccharide transport periplasmic protein LptA [Proteobacteria bacterium]|jgi:lipopolysaccharide export system protein LptA|nr:lipopolysaccharide transport periplasmic protein LptA [Pseudomonadota bacterium]